MISARYQNGFTLQELMLALAITIIVTAMGIPGYTSYVRDGSRDNTVNELYTDMYYARSEALKLNNNVVMCRSATTTSATPSCGGNTQDWTGGWLVFADLNNNNTFDSGTDKLLKIGTPIKGGIQVKTNSNADTNIVYRSDGSLSSPATAKFVVCDNRDGSYDPKYGRTIQISAMGRPEIETTPPSTCSP